MENENQTGTVLQEETRIPAAAEQSVPVDALPENAEVAEQTTDEQIPAGSVCECEAGQKPAAQVIPVTPEMVEKSKTVLGTMLDYLGLEGTVKAEGKANKINLLIASEDPGRIIGRKGQSLESLQTLLNRMMQKGEEQLFPKIYIDIEGYSSNSKRGEKHERSEL
ncbi:MAG: KH domain-containing protein [Lentisphaeria bacterium]|nr:KH domain-containing protein [Lentisphaeria bacterium]